MNLKEICPYVKSVSQQHWLTAGIHKCMCVCVCVCVCVWGGGGRGEEEEGRRVRTHFWGDVQANLRGKIDWEN